MRIAEAVERDVPLCNPGESLQEATETMWLWGYESLPVCDVEGKFVGSVSMRGMCLRCHLTGKTLADIQVREAVSHANVFCRPDDAAPAVMNLMCRSRFWHLPVVDDDHKLEGIVHYVDLLHRLTTARETLHVAGADDASL